MNNNFRSSSNSGNRAGYKAFGSTSSSMSGSSMGGSSMNRSTSSFGSKPSTGGSSSFGSKPFGGSSMSRTSSSFSSSSSFGGSRPMGGSSFGANRGQNGYGLMNSSFSGRPNSMNRPVSVYGKSTGFYFPRDNKRMTTTYRTNDTISFNQNSQILTAPEQQMTQDYYANQGYDATYADPAYDASYADQGYTEPAYDDQGYAEQAYDDAGAAYDDGGAAVGGDSPYGALWGSIEAQSGQSNSDIPRGVVLADRNGQVYAESFNYVDESGLEFDGEQYCLPDYAGGGAAGLVLYANAAPASDETLDLIIDSGVEELIIIAADEKEAKKAKKEKNYKKADKTLSKAGLVVDVVNL